MGPPTCSWTIKKAANGQGLFAAVTIKAGTRIIQEPPLLSISRHEAQSASEHTWIPAKVGLLSDDAQRQLMDLYHNPAKLGEFAQFRGQPCPGAVNIDSAVALAKFYTNAATIGSGQLVAGLFPIFCRMNHSCCPNTSWGYDDVSGMMQVYAARDIQQGEELTDAYTELARPRADRAKNLANLGFRCECHVCQGPQAEEHEMRRRRIWRCGKILNLYVVSHRTRQGNANKDIPVFAEIPKTDTDALKLAEEMAALLAVEGLVEELGAAYGRCAKFARGAGLVDVADVYDEQEFEILVRTTGECLQ
ncbi:SET domain-containing protein [Thozetella sp. PMI_491]|nr:SET domain-containing protein [Thozetella sp. PMI_491]